MSFTVNPFTDVFIHCIIDLLVYAVSKTYISTRWVRNIINSLISSMTRDWSVICFDRGFRLRVSPYVRVTYDRSRDLMQTKAEARTPAQARGEMNSPMPLAVPPTRFIWLPHGARTFRHEAVKSTLKIAARTAKSSYETSFETQTAGRVDRVVLKADKHRITQQSGSNYWTTMLNTVVIMD